MDINSQQLVNTFVGGMNTDTSDALLESNQYRYAENLRLFTNTDSNSGELRLVDGTEGKCVFETGTEILKLDKVRDIVTVITRKNNAWSVYLYKSGLNPTLLFGPCMTKIWKDREYPNLSTVLNYESENNIKLYIADGIHLIMVLKFSANDQNITPSTYIETLSGYTEVTLPSLDVLVSDASGYLKSAKVQYAYRLYKQGGSVTRLSPLSNTLSLYKDLKSGYANGFKSGRSVKISMPTAKLPENYFVNRKLNLSTGTIIDNYNIPGRDNQIHVNEISIAEYSQSTMVEENRRYCYYIEDELCSRHLQTDPLSPSEILYSYENQTPVRGLDSTHYFEKSSDDDSTWVKQNSRLIIVQLGTSRSIKECSRVIQIPYVLLLSEALDAGCITNGAWNAGSSVSIGKLPQMWPLGGVSDYTKQTISEVLDKILIFRINYVVNGQQPEVSVIYDGDYSANREIIDYGQDNARTISVSELLSYTEFGIIPKQIEVKNNYLFAANINYSKLNVDNLFKSLLISDYFTIEQCLGEPYRLSRLTQGALNTAFRPGETYRFGIIFYDEYGNKSSVFPLGNDITMGDYSLFEWLTFDDILIPGDGLFMINPPTIKIKQKASIPHCSQYEIVRCIRTFSDKRTITLGLVGKPAECWDGVPAYSNRTYVITPRELFSLGEIDEYTHDPTHRFNSDIRYATTSDSNILCFASPEYVYLPDDMKELLELSEGMLSIKQVANYIPDLRERTEGSDNIIYARAASFSNFPSIFVKDTTGSTIKYKHNRAYNSTECTAERLEVSRNNRTSFIKFNLISPRLKLQTSGMFNSTAASEIKELAYPKVPLYNEFASNDRLKFKDDATSIADYLYIGWSAPTYTVNNVSSSGDLFKMLTNGENGHAINFPIGTTGLCILVKVSNINSFTPNPSIMTYGPFLITVADILKTANPYGGDTVESKKNSTYYSFGDVFENKIDDHVLNSGDCYIRMFRYNALHNWFDTTISCATKCGTVYSVPMFMDIDLHGLYGEPYDYFYSNKGYYILDKAAAFDGYVQELDSYLYNTAYNAIPNIIGHSMNTDNEFTSQLYDTRIHYSEQKTNNENMDNWILFSALNFLDVDSRFGRITDLKLFKDRLMFWQEHAFGILAVNERVVLNDANDTQVVLGTGSVLDRYDYISTVYGMKLGQHTACVSNDALYWWDSYNKEILQYVDKSSLTTLTQAKNIRNYINSSSENTHPHIYYNSKYKEVVCSCVNNQSVAYNELLQRFTSVYTSLVPVSSIPVNDLVYLAYMNSIYATKTDKGTVSSIFGVSAKPKLKYVVNHNNTLPKTFDIQIIGGELYGGSERIVQDEDHNDVELFQGIDKDSGNHVYHTTNPLLPLFLEYKTPLNQTGRINEGKGITNREYDFRLNIPRETQKPLYGGRLRGKTMQCELWSTSNSTDFSLQYITTKYRMSWS